MTSPHPALERVRREVAAANANETVTGAWRQWLASPVREALDRAVADAVAAERERIAVLADEYGAQCHGGPDGWRGPFAAAIRGETSSEEARDG